MKFHFCAQQFLELPFPFPNLKKSLFYAFKKIFKFVSSWKETGNIGFLITEISTLVKTALKSYYSMLSPLALPCLPNDEVVYATWSSASMEIEAE